MAFPVRDPGVLYMPFTVYRLSVPKPALLSALSPPDNGRLARRGQRGNGRSTWSLGVHVRVDLMTA